MQSLKKGRRSLFYGVLLYGAAAPLLLLGGYFTLGPRRYYFLSFAVAVLAVIPFLWRVEAARHSARAVALASALSALAVAGRAAFFLFPQMKPMLAIVILSGVALGPQAGFFVGALSAFCSNFLFGQGPWTPFQMLAFGLSGFLAGALYFGGPLQAKKGSLALFGALCAVFLCGGILNFYSLVSFMPSFDMAAVLAVYGSGLPFDLSHGAATAVFLYLLADPLLRRLARMRVKYGIAF